MLADSYQFSFLILRLFQTKIKIKIHAHILMGHVYSHASLVNLCNCSFFAWLHVSQDYIVYMQT